MSEEKKLQQRLDEELEKLAVDLLEQIKGYDIVHSSVRVSKTPTDGVDVTITFGTLVREKYTWEAGRRTPLEQQFSDLAEEKAFDFARLVSAGSGDGYTDWTSVWLGTLVGGAT